MVNIWSIFDLIRPACLACGITTTGPGLLCTGCRNDLPLVPDGCPHCALPWPAGGSHCTACTDTPTPITRTFAAVAYAFPVDALVRQLKFEGRLPVAAALADVLLGRIRNAGVGDSLPQALVPVPLHPSRQRERGFNQAERIAAPIARGLCIPLRAQAVVRRRATVAQSGIDLRARQQNLQGAFSVVEALPAHVAIIDDVSTSGSTLRAVAYALADAGVSRIDAWVVARTL